MSEVTEKVSDKTRAVPQSSAPANKKKAPGLSFRRLFTCGRWLNQRGCFKVLDWSRDRFPYF